MQTSNQNQIYGDYSIVSVYRNQHSVAKNRELHQIAMMALLSRGYTVTQLVGFWDDACELSIKIEGLGHAGMAKLVARDYSQDAYIVVCDRLAHLLERRGAGYEVSQVFHSVTYQPPITGNHSELMSGAKFKFI